MIVLLQRLGFGRAPRVALGPMARVPAGLVRLPDGRRRLVLGFLLDLRPVNNAEWLAFAQATGAACPPWIFRPGWDDPAQPVVGVTQDEAEAFARWAKKRLPSEAQWQRAVGTGTYPWGERAPDPARALFGRSPHRGAGARPDAVHRPEGAGPFGHLDLSGNVWERLRGSVARGGFWGSPDPRAALRLELAREERSGGVGFRCAL